MNQWKERLKTFLGLSEAQIGSIDGGRRKPGGVVDIASIQSKASSARAKWMTSYSLTM